MAKAAKIPQINPETMLKRKQNQLFSEIDGEVVMLSVENSEYYGMDAVGSRIWQLLENERSYDNLIKTLLEEYEVTEEQCRTDSLAFLEQLFEKKLVEITSPNPS